MRNNLSNHTGFKDQLLINLVKDVQAGFDAISDETIHKVTIVWNPPVSLLVSYFGGGKRLRSPDYIRCERAVNLTDSTILVTPGGVAFEWVGNGNVRIDAVSGLTVGDMYELVCSAGG